MTVSLRKATLNDAELIWRMQITAFKPLLDKYQDYDYSPGAETLERTVYRMSLPIADHWLILLEDAPIGAIGIGRYEGCLKLKRLFILPSPSIRTAAMHSRRFVWQKRSIPPGSAGNWIPFSKRISSAISMKSWATAGPGRPSLSKRAWTSYSMPNSPCFAGFAACESGDIIFMTS